MSSYFAYHLDLNKHQAFLYKLLAWFDRATDQYASRRIFIIVLLFVQSQIKQEHTSHQNKVIEVYYIIHHRSERMNPCCPVSSQLAKMFWAGCVCRCLLHS